MSENSYNSDYSVGVKLSVYSDYSVGVELSENSYNSDYSVGVELSENSYNSDYSVILIPWLVKYGTCNIQTIQNY